MGYRMAPTALWALTLVSSGSSLMVGRARFGGR